MDNRLWFDLLPVYVIFLFTVAYTLLAIFIGMRLCGFESKSGYEKTKGQMGSVVGATLGLLAFILAFTFNMSANRFDARKQLLLNEVNAIKSTYIRAALLPVKFKNESQTLLREYVGLRIQAGQSTDRLDELIERSEEIHRQLWTMVEKLYAEKEVPSASGLFLHSLNELIDLHTKRVVVGLHSRIPITIWFGLYIVAALAMTTVGYYFGQTRRTPGPISIILALAFSSVLTIIVDLDRAGSGSVRVDHQPFIELQKGFSN